MDLDQIVRDAFMSRCKILQNVPTMGGFTGDNYRAYGKTFTRGKAYAHLYGNPSTYRIAKAASILGHWVDLLISGKVAYGAPITMDMEDDECDGSVNGWEALGDRRPVGFLYLGAGVPHIVKPDVDNKGDELRIRLWGQLITAPPDASKLQARKIDADAWALQTVKMVPVVMDQLVTSATTHRCTCDMKTVLLRSGCKCGGV